jgi:hypothetical protein
MEDWKRVAVGFVCLVGAPILGVWAGGSMHNPAGNGPGAWQLVVGIAVPASLALVTAHFAHIGSLEASAWVVVSLPATGGLVLFLIWALAGLAS